MTHLCVSVNYPLIIEQNYHQWFFRISFLSCIYTNYCGVRFWDRVRFRTFFGPEVFIVTLPYTKWKMRFDADPYVLWQKNQSNKCTKSDRFRRTCKFIFHSFKSCYNLLMDHLHWWSLLAKSSAILHHGLTCLGHLGQHGTDRIISIYVTPPKVAKASK